MEELLGKNPQTDVTFNSTLSESPLSLRGNKLIVKFMDLTGTNGPKITNLEKKCSPNLTI